MDEQKLRQIAGKNRTSKAIFKALSERNRHVSTTDVRRLMYEIRDGGGHIVVAELEDTFREFERAGLGKLIRQTGQPLRFTWAKEVNVKEIGAAGLNKSLVAQDTSVPVPEKSLNIIELARALQQVRPALSSLELEFLRSMLK